jgi:hypothetical protein
MVVVDMNEVRLDRQRQEVGGPTEKLDRAVV